MKGCLATLRKIVMYTLVGIGLLTVLLITLFILFPTDKPTQKSGSIAMVPTFTSTPFKQIILVATSTPTATPLPTNTPRPTSTSTPVPTAPSFEEIRSNMLNMTDAQWKQYSSGLKGTFVIEWSGWVDDVSTMFGGYNLLIDMDPPDELSVYDVSFDIPSTVALKFQKNTKVVFSGKIKRAYNLLGSVQIDLVDASVVSQ